MYELVGIICTLLKGFENLIIVGVHLILYQNVPKDTIYINMSVLTTDFTYIMNLIVF